MPVEATSVDDKGAILDGAFATGSVGSGKISRPVIVSPAYASMEAPLLYLVTGEPQAYLGLSPTIANNPDDAGSDHGLRRRSDEATRQQAAHSTI